MSRRRRLGDETIPRRAAPTGNTKQQGAAGASVAGALIDRGGGAVDLVAKRSGNPVPSAWCTVQQGTQANPVEGFHRAPRLWSFTDSGDPTSIGDNFLVTYLDADPMKPVLIGGFRPLDQADPDFFPPNPIGADPNPMRGRWAHYAGGGMTGHVQLRALETGGDLELVVGGRTFGEGLRVAFDNDDKPFPTIKIGRGNETEHVLLGKAFLTTLNDALTEIVAMAVAIPYVLAIPPAPGIGVLIAEINQSLAASGAPLLSRTVKVE